MEQIGPDSFSRHRVFAEDPRSHDERDAAIVDMVRVQELIGIIKNAPYDDDSFTHAVQSLWGEVTSIGASDSLMDSLLNSTMKLERLSDKQRQVFQNLLNHAFEVLLDR